MAVRFSLTIDGEPVISAPLDEHVHGTSEVPFGELQFCGFVIDGRDREEYRIRVGDLEVLARAFYVGKSVLWEDGAHLESASGPTRIQLESRQLGSSDSWRLRAMLNAIVVPEKLGYGRYLAMLDDLQGLAAGLVFDLVSKSARALRFGGAVAGGVAAQSAQLELRALERLWAELSDALRLIQVDPVSTLRPVRERRRCWGSGRMSAATLRELVVNGISPTSDRVQCPFPAVLERLQNSFDTPEHRTIAGFLSFMSDRVADCIRRAEASMNAIERDRHFRSIQLSSEPSLYELYDWPRVLVLQEACERAGRLRQQIELARRLPFLRMSRSLYFQPQSPVFDHVRPYRELRSAMLRYFRSSMVMLDSAGEERIKSTSRMYEQWVFLQIAAAMREAGLVCNSFEGLLTRTRSYRYTLDLERNTAIVYRAPGDRVVRLRYEPYIFPLAEASDRGDMLYRGVAGETPWTPDVLIEVFPRDSDSRRKPDLEYALVLDAKYSRRITADHWSDTSKYLQIRSIHDNRPVVKQLWLVYPGQGAPVCRDPAVGWLEAGPNRPTSEVVDGELGMIPPEGGLERREGASRVTPQCRRFVQGLLHYLGLSAESIDASAA
jgi:hypothetical protein